MKAGVDDELASHTAASTAGRLRIGIDGSAWANRRGYGRFTRALVSEMAGRDGPHRCVLVIDRPSLGDADLPPGLDVVPVHVGEAPSRAAAAGGRRSLLDVARMSVAARRARCDVFWFPTSYTYFPVLGPPTVVTVHDAIPETLSSLVVPSWPDRLLWDLKQRVALRRAELVLTVSGAARADVGRTLGVPDRRLRTVGEAPDPVFVPMAADRRQQLLGRFGLGPGDPYVLYAGGISPHKNLGVLVAAFADVAASRPDVRLVIAGDLDDDPFLSSARSLRAAVAASPAGGRITLTGFVTDHELAALYGGAVATVQPSLGEGFGLTAAESAACGTPVVASDLPALVELLGDAALFAPPHQPDAFAAALARLFGEPDERQRLSEASLERARLWSWSAAADTVLGVLEEAVRARG